MGGLKKNYELQSTQVVTTRHELGSPFMQGERSTTELPEYDIALAQY